MAKLSNTIVYGVASVTSYIKESGQELAAKYAGKLNLTGTTLALRNQEDSADLDTVDIGNAVDSHLTGGTGIDYTSGDISIDSTVLQNADVDDTPVDAATDVPVSSNWAYDHANNISAHHSRYALTEDLASGEISQLQNINSVTITNTQ